RSVFARKNYFYPDLPKGYQISQYTLPLGRGGEIAFKCDGAFKVVHLQRIHLEEDAGKLLHPEGDEPYSRVDFNRCGVPLIEIVSEPEIFSPREAYCYLQMLKQIMQYLRICSGDMEKGHLRCDANISVRPAGSDAIGIRTEVKNLNSFKMVEAALAYEIDRQVKSIKSGGIIDQATLLWDENLREALPMRSKEESQDYRYFPEPDLVDLVVGPDWLDSLKVELPEMADKRARRFVRQYRIPEYDAQVLTDSRELADYFEAVMSDFDDGKIASNWIMTELLKIIKEEKILIADFRVTPKMVAELLGYVRSGEISGRIAKEVFAMMAATGRPAGQIIEEKGLVQITDQSIIKSVIERVIFSNEKALEKYLQGKKQVFGFFVGQVMKETGGKANPELVNTLVQERLDELEG
ncbi:MAG: Asp-tRNA(Asn)/Glu-tRNA(Gln) amidotransferase subunit GatB, partial [Candidatus Zixiibacteriota bacterium]